MKLEIEKIKKVFNKSFLKKMGLTVLVILGLVVVTQIFVAEKYRAVVRVTEEKGVVGVNPMADKLDYGDLSRGASAIRYVTLENGGRLTIRIISLKFGGIADLVAVSRNNFILNPGETEKLEYRLRMPPSANRERYSGWVWLFKIPIL